ncbi:MAG: ABC transporter substrate-binding protein [Ectothiorhodospiraceae bacterium]|nr:ABC transporter substrate-binding protein [Ectothiorhodospiraceae bacterium]
MRPATRCAATLSLLGAALVAGPAAAQSTVTVARQIDTDRYDPHISTARGTAEIMFMVGDTLVTLDYDMKTIRPGLAESWTVSDDGLTYTFKLKQGVKFCSGKAFTANDVKASIDRWLAHPKGVTKTRAGPVDALTVIDDHTLEYKLKQPYSELLFQMTQHNHTVLNIDQVNALGDDYGVKPFDGTGPYCMESWEPRNEVVMRKHVGYDWGPPFYEHKEAQVDKVVWKVVPEEGTRVASLKTGQIDVTQYVPYWAMAELEAMPNMSVSQAEAYFWTQYVGMKITRDGVSDEVVRKAINLAIDQKALAESVYFGLAEPAYAYISPKVLDYDAGMDLGHFGYDPDKARKMLDDAGWKPGSDGVRAKDGKRLSFRTYGFAGTLNRDMLEAMQGDLRKIGVEMNIEIHDATVIWGLLAKQDFDMYAMSYPYVSAGDALNLYFPSKNMPTPNRMNWENKQTDEWLSQANAALTDADRAALLGKVQRQVHDAAVWVPIVHEPLFLVSSAKLQPIRAHGIYGCGLYKGLGLAMK